MKQTWSKFILTLLMFFAISWIFGTGLEGVQLTMLGYLMFDNIKDKYNE